MDVNFPRALADVLLSEGGYVNHPNDPGGPTNMGVTLATYRKWVKKGGTADDLRGITREQVAKVYRSVYWNAVKGDDLPSGVDYAVFDYAVNSGPGRAIKALQGVLGVEPDGEIGPVTLAALKTASPVTVVNELCTQRLEFLKNLSTWPTFGKGWSRRVASVREDSLQLTIADPKPAPSTSPRFSLIGAIIELVKAILAELRKK